MQCTSPRTLSPGCFTGALGRSYRYYGVWGHVVARVLSGVILWLNDNYVKCPQYGRKTTRVTRMYNTMYNVQYFSENFIDFSKIFVK